MPIGAAGTGGGGIALEYFSVFVTLIDDASLDALDCFRGSGIGLGRGGMVVVWVENCELAPGTGRSTGT